MKRSYLAILMLAMAPAAQAASSEIFRCTAPNGSVTYQQFPCATPGAVQAVEIALSFPDPDSAQRDRLCEREAALDKRLEAMRDRLTAESVARISRPEPVVVVQEPTYIVNRWPGRPARSGIRRSHPTW